MCIRDSGIGRAIARTFAAYGADLVIADMDEEKIVARAKEIAEESGRELGTHIIPCLLYTSRCV